MSSREFGLVTLTLALSVCAHAAEPTRTVACQAMPEGAPPGERFYGIWIQQDAAGYQVKSLSQTGNGSVLFETPDRRKAVLVVVYPEGIDAVDAIIPKALGRPPEKSFSIVTVDFGSPKVQTYDPRHWAPDRRSDPLSISPVWVAPDCKRLD